MTVVIRLLILSRNRKFQDKAFSCRSVNTNVRIFMRLVLQNVVSLFGVFLFISSKSDSLYPNPVLASQSSSQRRVERIFFSWTQLSRKSNNLSGLSACVCFMTTGFVTLLVTNTRLESRRQQQPHKKTLLLKQCK